MTPLFLVNGIFPAYSVLQPGFSLEGIEANLAYILDGEGWKIYKRNGVSTAIINVDSVSGLPQLDSTIIFTAAKLPLDLIRRVTAWFRAVYLKHKSEAAGYLYYQPKTEEWDYVPPAQTVGAAHVNYEAAPKKEGWQVAGTIHSHAAMSAFHSGVDDHDEQFFDGVHITIGKLDSVPEYSCSLVVHGKRAMFDASQLIDGMAPAEAIPQAWLNAVKLPAPRGLSEPFLARATSLYERYYAGAITEAAYQVELGKIEKESEVAEKLERERSFASPAKTPLRFDDPDESERLSGYRRSAEAAADQLFAAKKGGKHGSRR